MRFPSRILVSLSFMLMFCYLPQPFVSEKLMGGKPRETLPFSNREKPSVAWSSQSCLGNHGRHVWLMPLISLMLKVFTSLLLFRGLRFVDQQNRSPHISVIPWEPNGIHTSSLIFTHIKRGSGDFLYWSGFLVGRLGLEPEPSVSWYL